MCHCFVYFYILTTFNDDADGLPSDFVDDGSVRDALGHSVDGGAALVARLRVCQALGRDVAHVRDELVRNS